MLISRKAFEKALEDERRKVNDEWIKSDEIRRSGEYAERRFAQLEERIRRLERRAGEMVDEDNLCWPTKG